MNGFDPGEGWRQIEPGTPLQDERDVLTLDTLDGKRSWVREAPVPPLPTVGYTVIRATFPRLPAREYVLAGDGHGWFSLYGPRPEHWTPSILQEEVSGFEVLAEPRAVTAKAVLDRVRGHVEARGEDPDHEMFGLAAIARAFGVDQ